MTATDVVRGKWIASYALNAADTLTHLAGVYGDFAVVDGELYAAERDDEYVTVRFAALDALLQFVAEHITSGQSRLAQDYRRVSDDVHGDPHAYFGRLPVHARWVRLVPLSGETAE